MTVQKVWDGSQYVPIIGFEDKHLVKKSGDTMTGPLAFNNTQLWFNTAAGKPRWKLYEYGTEAAGNAGNDLVIGSIDNNDAYLNNVLSLMRTGQVLVSQDPLTTMSVATKGYVDRAVVGIASSSATATSLSSTWARVTMNAPSTLLGGVTWNSTHKGFTVPTDGLYLIMGKIGISSNATASHVKVGVSTSGFNPAVETMSTYVQASPPSTAWLNMNWLHSVTAGETLGLCAYSSISRTCDYNAVQIVRLAEYV